ncbi:hypothetical protein VTL71DRAFT_11382 [Oculimacula yallundae]|uniref:F-box domain-containing protein n=1 Tax=Oculimacula yallundae TaxID=86028 RepID=A0ABR4CQ22_9HELO
METSSAKDRVLSLPELLIAIIIQLPQREILVNAQRVSHKWHAIVKSQRIQQALFFASSSPTEPVFNPMLTEAFPPWFKPPNTTSYLPEQSFDGLDWASSSAKRDAYSRKEASWRKMLVVQPPARTLEIVQCKSYPRGTWKKVGNVTFADGVRMGVLFDYAQNTVSSMNWWFCVQWHILNRVDEEHKNNGASIEENLDREIGLGDSKVTLRTNYSFQCVKSCRKEYGPGHRFRSEGYKELKVIFGEETSCGRS